MLLEAAQSVGAICRIEKAADTSQALPLGEIVVVKHLLISDSTDLWRYDC